MFDESRWKEVGEVADGVTRLGRLNLYDMEEKNDVLLTIADLCCGFGRMSMEFARRGFITTGVDITSSYLKTAKEEASYEKLKINYIKEDVRIFRSRGAFNLAVNLYNSFGFFENPEDDLLFAKNAYYSLKPGGAFIIEVLGKEIAARDYTSADWFERAGFTVLTESEPIDSWSSMWNKWVIIKGAERHEKVFIQRLYAASEMRRLLFKAGFSEVEIYGSWEDVPYNADAKMLIAVGRKKK